MPDTNASPSRDSASGLLRIAAAATTWGTIPLVLSAVAGVPAFVIVFWRVAISGAAMLVISAVRKGGLSELRTMSRRRLLGLAANGVLLAVNWVLFFSGLKLAGVAVGEILGYMGPVFVAALTPFVPREVFDRRVLLPLARLSPPARHSRTRSSSSTPSGCCATHTPRPS
jgi:drug/metabolite transporter (DMT)-like permease